MKKIFLFIYILVLSQTAKAIDFVELPIAGSNIVVIKMMFRNGSISDPKGKEGLTWLTVNTIMDGGTQKMSSSEVKDFSYPMAAEYFGTVDKEVTVFTFRIHKELVGRFYDLVQGLILTPRFAEDDFERSKSNQLNFVEQVIKTSSDEEFSKMALEDFLFRGTNYQAMTRGTASGIKNITLDDVKAHYKRYFTSGNLTVGIAGGYTEDLRAMLEKDLTQLPAMKDELPFAGKANGSQGLEVEIIQKKGALGSAVFAGFELPVTRSNNEFAALMIANSWLGEHRKSYSRLYKKIREERSMNYGDYTYIEWYSNGGQNMLPRPGTPRNSNYFSIWLRPVQTADGLKKQYEELSGINIGHAHFALRMALREMQLLIDKGMGEKDFELTKKFLRSYIKLYAQTPEQQLGYLLDSRFYGRQDWLKEIDGMLEKVTYADMMANVKKYWNTQNMKISIVTDITEAGPLKESLENNSDSPMSYSNALKAVLTPEILAEDKLVQNYPLKASKVTIINAEDMFK
jgi:zinc protease